MHRRRLNMKIESELKVVAHGDLPIESEVNIIPDPSEQEAMFRIVANTISMEVKNELSAQSNRERSDDGNG